MADDTGPHGVTWRWEGGQVGTVTAGERLFRIAPDVYAHDGTLEKIMVGAVWVINDLPKQFDKVDRTRKYYAVHWPQYDSQTKSTSQYFDNKEEAQSWLLVLARMMT